MNSIESTEKTLLLEIGTEEIPAGMMADALAQLESVSSRLMAEERLEGSDCRVFGTPRRLILLVEQVAPQQRELSEWVRGPSREVAFEPDGTPTQAGKGFARSQGVDVQDLVIRDTDKGEYVFAERVEPGKPSAEVLQKLLPRLIRNLEFEQTMRWGSYDFEFVRPIRWLVALYGDSVIPFELAGVKSGRETCGHRTLAPQQVEVEHADEFLELLQDQYVLAAPEQRRQRIEEQVQELLAASEGHANLEGKLLEEVVHLIEWPTSFLGDFSPEYLELPREVLVTSMRVHQRYFPVEDTEGELLPMFVGVRNGDERYLDIVREGNEKVLRARLADAQFFFDEDRQQPLEAYVDRLRTVVFQEQLGTYYDKTARVRHLAEGIANALQLSRSVREYVDRAAQLCKADQVTAMVQEFPALEGVMGREYALLSGEPEPVARAIYEHQLPRGTGDELPQTMAGTIVSLADKLDTLAGCFAVGIRPSGSSDPYALRRKAVACIRVMGTAQLDISLGLCLELALDQHDVEHREQIQEELTGFFRRRFEALLRDEGFRHEVIQAVLEAGFDRVPEVWRRASTLKEFHAHEAFDDVMTVFTRAHNLATNAQSAEVHQELLSEEEEVQLYRAVEEAEVALESCIKERDYLGYLEATAVLREPVDTMLDNLMVMVDEESIQRNRLALLRRVDKLFEPYFDLTQLEW